jgi:hypothetical protein
VRKVFAKAYHRITLFLASNYFCHLIFKLGKDFDRINEIGVESATLKMKQLTGKSAWSL